MTFTNGWFWKFVPFVLSWSMIQTTTYALFLPPCVDLYTGNCTQDFGNQCNKTDVQILCPKTCNACPTTTTTTTTTPAPCRDMYAGDCGVFLHICDQHDAQTLCPKTCGVCPYTTTTTTATSTTTTTTTTATTTTTTRTTTTTTPCLDKYLGDCSVGFPTCSGLVAQFACARFCGICTVPYKKDCMDLFTGSCAADYGNRCNEPDVDILCPMTCGLCTNTTGTFRPPTIQAPTTTTLQPTTTTTTATTTTTLPSTTTTTTATTTTTTPVTTTEVPCEDKYNGDCMADFGIGNCGDLFVQTACRKFCGLCTPTSTTLEPPTTSQAPTTTTLEPPTTTQAPTTTTLEPPTTTQASTTTTLEQTTTSQALPTATTSMTTTTPTTTTTEAPCVDLFIGQCPPDGFTCDNVHVHMVCPKTCGLCDVPTTTIRTTTKAPCKDTFTGDCLEMKTNFGCNDVFVNFVCHKTCGLCTP